jgi:hypothetical protein
LRHLFNRLFTIPEDRLEEFYHHHLKFYLSRHPQGDEMVFFQFLWEKIESQLHVLQARDVYDRDHIRNLMNADRLKRFRWILTSLDRWDIHSSDQPIIERQEQKIYALEQEITSLRAELVECRGWDGYIQIRDDQALALLDMFIQMQALKAPDGGALFITAAQNTWAKIICKFFREVDPENPQEIKQIKQDRLRHYLRGMDPKDPTKRDNEIPQNHRLFTISPVKRRKH